jgi:hypothetical protein
MFPENVDFVGAESEKVGYLGMELMDFESKT